MSKRVVILARVLPDYRIAFFDALAKRLADVGLELNVHAGQASSNEYFKEADCTRPYLKRVNNLYLWKGIYLQRHVWRAALNSDIVVFEQASRAIVPYGLMLLRGIGRRSRKLAFWGHGQDFSKNKPLSLSVYWKRFWLNKVDYWFAYSNMVATVIQSSGIPSDKFVVVNNASDTRRLSSAVNAVSNNQKHILFEKLWKEKHQPDMSVGVVCTRLFASKGIELLLNSCAKVHNRLEHFRLLIIGDGPMQYLVKQFAKNHDWCVWHTAMHGIDRAPLLSLADIWLNPGTTGLAILDAFACGIPYATVKRPDHGPEIAYLSEDNGLITECRASAFSDAIVDLLINKRRLNLLKQGARRAAGLYSVEAMADRFTEGLLQCLGVGVKGVDSMGRSLG